MIDITEIVVAVIGLLSVIVTSVVVPLIKSKLTNSQWESICNYAVAGVQAAEIILSPSCRPLVALHAEGVDRNCTHGPRTILSSSAQRTASRLTPIQYRSPLRMPGRRWGWIRSSSQQTKQSVKRNRPLCKYIYIF